MKFKSIVRQLILENVSRFKVIYDKMVLPSEKALQKNPNSKGIMPFEVLTQIIFADPDTKTPENFDKEGASVIDMENVKVGKYTNWILKHFAIPNLPEAIKSLDFKSKEYKDAVTEYKRLYLEDLFKMTQQLEFYEKAKQYIPLEKRDINKLTPNDLEDIYVNFKLPEKVMAKQQKKEVKKEIEGIKHPGGDIIYHGEDWIVVEIDPKKNKDAVYAALHYGGNQKHREGESNWCTSAPGNALPQGEKGHISHFSYYVRKGPLYVIIPTDDKGEVSPISGLPKDRYQFNFPEKQFMNLQDKQINLGEYFGLGGKMREIFDNLPKFQEEFANMYSQQSQGSSGDVIISYPSSNGLFEIFGIDSLFEKLSPNIETLSLINTTKDSKRAFNIPESLGRFTKLTSIVFDSSAKTIPNSITKLDSLDFLSIINCPEVKTIPEGIADMEELSFLSIKGSTNLKIPPRLLETLNETSPGLFHKFD
jgi:hypothetical protein